MFTESIAVLVALFVLGLGALYAFQGHVVSHEWKVWITGACVAAGVFLGVGVLTLGLPGTIFLELLGPKLPSDSIWPMAIAITEVGAVIIVPASLALRLALPRVSGWSHVLATALVSIVATYLFAVLLTSRALP